jgi:hypothetical protein
VQSEQHENNYLALGIAALALVEVRRAWYAESLEDTCCA